MTYRPSQENPLAPLYIGLTGFLKCPTATFVILTATFVILFFVPTATFVILTTTHGCVSSI